MKIVVIGATGMLGHKILKILSEVFPGCVYGMIRKSKSEFTKLNICSEDLIIENMNIEHPLEIFNKLEDLKPDFVINCSGVTLRKIDNASIEKNYNINSFFPQALSDLCTKINSKLIHFSTDCVFDGKNGNYVESDYPSAQDVYGRSKYLGETKGNKNSLTLRISIVGRELYSFTELLEWFLLQKNNSINGYSQVYYTGLTTNYLAKEVVRIIQNYSDLNGVYHISSEKISKYDLLSKFNFYFKNNTTINLDNFKKSDKSLNCDKYSKMTSFKIPTWDAMISELIQENQFYERVKNVLSR